MSVSEDAVVLRAVNGCVQSRSRLQLRRLEQLVGIGMPAALGYSVDEYRRETYISQPWWPEDYADQYAHIVLVDRRLKDADGRDDVQRLCQLARVEFSFGNNQFEPVVRDYPAGGVYWMMCRRGGGGEVPLDLVEGIMLLVQYPELRGKMMELPGSRSSVGGAPMIMGDSLRPCIIEVPGDDLRRPQVRVCRGEVVD